MIQNPYITDGYGVQVLNPINDQVTTAQNLRSQYFDGSATATYDEMTLNAFSCTFKPVSSDESLVEFAKSNVVSNGEFETNVSGFGATRCSLAWNSNEYCEMTQNSGSDNTMSISQSEILSVGKRYKITL